MPDPRTRSSILGHIFDGLVNLVRIPDIPRSSEPEMLTFPFNYLFKTDHFQLRLPSLPFREPDPSQECLHFLFNSFFKAVYFQLRLPSLPFREPDPSQKCLHVLSITRNGGVRVIHFIISIMPRACEPPPRLEKQV